MPELPEVETIRRNVNKHLVGHTLIEVSLTLPKLMRQSPILEMDALVSSAIVSARRRSKVLILDWTNGLSLLIHFKLAGQLAMFLADGERVVAGHPVPKPDGPYPHKATHLTWWFDGGTIVYFSDVRQFGWLRLLPTDDVDAAIAEFGFGPEGTDLSDDAGGQLVAILERRRIPIKQVLLDQSVIAGLGNIYVDEVLHRSRVHPARPASSLQHDEIALIVNAIPWVLARGIEQGGARIVSGKAYPVDNFPAVHGREGEPCFICGGQVAKIRVGNRGTYYCPQCQVLD